MALNYPISTETSGYSRAYRRKWRRTPHEDGTPYVVTDYVADDYSV